MDIVVTGGCGFIGSNLVERLIKDGHAVTIFDNLSTGNLNNLKGLDVKLFNKPYHHLHGLGSRCDVIFHLGIPSSAPMYKQNPRLVGEAINDAIEVFEYANERKCKVVYASSSSIYNGNRLPFREDMNIFVTDYYTECRLAIERLASLYNMLYGVKSVGLRFFSVYGPKEGYKGRYANILSQFLWSMLKDERPLVFGDGTQTRDFIYVTDVVESLILAMMKDFDREIFNVGSGVANSFNDIVDLLNEALSRSIQPIYKPNPIKNYVLHTLADTSRAECVLGFKAQIPLRKGIALLLEDVGARGV